MANEAQAAVGIVANLDVGGHNTDGRDASEANRPSWAKAAPRDSSEMDGAAVAILALVVACSVGYTEMQIHAALATRLGAMEQRTEVRLGAMEQRTEMQLGAMEKRTDMQLGAIEKRTEIQLGAMEQRIISAMEQLQQQTERQLRRRNPETFQDLVDHKFAGKHSNAALFASSEQGTLVKLLQEHETRTLVLLVEAARSRRQVLTGLADSESATDAECEAAEVSAAVFMESH